MLSKQDGYRLLLEIRKSSGDNVDKYLIELSKSNEVPREILRFINSKRPTGLYAFYESLRKKNNDKVNRLYLNIMREDLTDAESVKTLSSYVTQTVIAAEQCTVELVSQIYEQARVKDAAQAINSYFANGNTNDVREVLLKIKADIKMVLDRES